MRSCGNKQDPKSPPEPLPTMVVEAKNQPTLTVAKQQTAIEAKKQPTIIEAKKSSAFANQTKASTMAVAILKRPTVGKDGKPFSAVGKKPVPAELQALDFRRQEDGQIITHVVTGSR